MTRLTADAVPAAQLSHRQLARFPLSDELHYHATRAGAPTAAEQKNGRSIIIMGNQEMPYKVLKHILSTCADSDYRNISLAVNSAATTSEAQALEVAGR